MDLNELIGQLYTYGPYAVLALFVFWVAPKQTRVFLECNDLKDKLKRSLCGGVALACWIIVMLMVVFIYRNWSPLTVYQGDFGRHKPNIEFLTQSEHLYLTQTGSPVDQATHWSFAIIDDSNPNTNKEYSFTYLRKGKNPRDYVLMSKDLKAGYNKISIDPDDETKINISNKATGKTMPLSIARNESNLLPKGKWMTAFAQANNYQYIVGALISDNHYVLAQARKELRSIPKEALEELLTQQDLPDNARQQIEDELKQRPIRELR